ncbi:DUF4364 family protein [Dethiothermospora halolimnae]|uniref:DUF4364 family protein n=1 Tax=Dethiothermospora halolimnae TaxID=3114390 RepID=UPI003CCB9A92
MIFENTKELAEHKLLLLYIIDQIDIPMNNTEITQFVLENNYMNYFIVQQYLSELVNSNFIELANKDGKEFYRVSNLGKETLNYFINRIPDRIKTEIDKRYKKKRKELIKESQIVANYFKKNDSEFIVNLKVVEKDITLFNLSLNVVSNKQAKLICDNWKKDPQRIYEKIFHLFTSDS